MPFPTNLSRRAFVAGGSLALVAGESPLAQDKTADAPVIGPLVGHTDGRSTVLWARMTKPGKYDIQVRPVDGAGPAVTVSAATTVDQDLTIHWKVQGLSPATRYQVVLPDGGPCSFATPPADGQPACVSLAFGSCALETAGSRAVWNRMAAEEVDAVVLGGDTPYIDRNDLATQRRRHREFASVAEYQALVGTRPFWTTWDDHDFGANDADGTLADKRNVRQAFTEYRPQAQFGDGQGGIYHHFRWGPIEVFLIDARWWSWTGPSFADRSRKTLLGEAQWSWLRTALKASTATFKVLATGIIWDDKQNKEKDDWGTYAHERQALFDFLKAERISGVSLFGGDIHVSRALRYSADAVGYPLHQFISSPIHDRVIPSLNVPHPDLIRSAAHPHTFLKLTADTTVSPARLTARFLDKDGQQIFDDVATTIDELTPPAG